MKKVVNKLPLDYHTIRLTRSRIDKGLLAIPLSLVDYFPKARTKIILHLGYDSTPVEKKFTPYASSSRECRIGGLKKWYQKENLFEGDELVLFMVEKEYCLVKESAFKKQFETLSEKLLKTLITEQEEEVEINLKALQRKTGKKEKEILISQFFKVNKVPVEKRKRNLVKQQTRREAVPKLIKKILGAIYDGKCQVSNFSFLQKNGTPYFEIHHLNPERGNDWKNLLVVSPNVHAQFTYGLVKHYFDSGGWLRNVKLGSSKYDVKQLLDKIQSKTFKKTMHQA